MKVIRLEAENVKRIVAVDITPEGNLVEITGKNGQGKTSVLDSIFWALTGTTDIQAKPIREGEESAVIRLDLGDLKVTRTFNKQEDGSFTTSLKLMNADGAQYPSPQKRLDALTDAMSFDPLGFVRAGPAAQVSILRSLTGLDFHDLDRKRQAAFDERTAENRAAREMRGAAAAVQVPENAPEAEVDVSAILGEIETASAHNADVERRAGNRRAANERITAISARLAEMQAEMDALRREADELRKRIDGAGSLPEPIDISELRAQADAAGSLNAAFQAVKRRADFEERALASEEKADLLTKAIDGFDAAKRQMITEAKMPVEGLGFGDGVVTFGGLPLDQASDAEQLRAGIAIAAAMNPDLRVIRVRDGSLLDQDSMKLLGKFAKEKDMQVWIETIQSDREGAILIEDGSVKEIVQGAKRKPRKPA